MKKLFASVLVLILMFSSITSAFADDRSGTLISWRLASTTNSGTETIGSWVLQYSGAPAGATGETSSISFAVSYNHTFSGSFMSGMIKDAVQVQLGYSYGVSKTFSVTQTSRPLAKGEYVKAYSINNYEKTTVKQEEIKTTWWSYPTPGTTVVPTGNTQYVSSYRAILPQIKLEYWKNGVKVSGNMTYSNMQKPYKVEYYEADESGKYSLTSTQYN